MRLIDGDELYREYQSVVCHDIACAECKAVDKDTGECRVDYLISDAPTIEPKRGEWKPFDLTWGRSIWYCTACEESTEVPCDIWEHKPIYKYCPNCGADMRGADDE